jgi:hypothetical protein
MKNFPWLLITNNIFRSKTTFVLLPDLWLYYLTLHLRFSSSSRFLQLVEIFAYENATASTQNQNFFYSQSSPVTLIYQFNNLYTQDRVFIFLAGSLRDQSSDLKTLGEVFSTSI